MNGTRTGSASPPGRCLVCLASRDLSVEIFFDRLLIFLHLYVSFFLFFFKEDRGKKLFGKRLSRDE